MPVNYLKQYSIMASIKFLKKIDSFLDNAFAETWVFFVSGALLFIGTLAHGIAHYVYGAGLSDVFFRMWVPLFIVIYLLWMVSYYREMTRKGLPLFPKILIKHGMSDV